MCDSISWDVQDSSREPDSVIIPLHSPDSVIRPAEESESVDLPVPDFTADTVQTISDVVAAIGESLKVNFNIVKSFIYL